jgi:WD40 repeat protein
LTALAFNGKEIALGEDGGAVRLVDVAAGRERCTLLGSTRLISCLVFAADGTTLAAGHLGGTVTVWDTTTGQARAALAGHRTTPNERDLAGVQGLTFSPDGTVLASVGCFDRCVKLWDVATGREKATLSGHPSWLLSVAYAPAGGFIAAGGQDGGITLWDPTTGSVRASWRGHADQVQALAFSADGALLASGGADAVVRFWDVARVLTSGVTAARPPARGNPAR